MTGNEALPWKVSLHGGHSEAYCDHATGTLREMLTAAVSEGYDTFGVSEHAPRLGDHLLYEEERKRGWGPEKLVENFEAYARDLAQLASEFDDRLTVLRGFEIEVVPEDRYVEIMLGYRRDLDFEYIVGSVHHVDEVLIDGPPDEFRRAVNGRGGLENLCLAYYQSLARMVEAVSPEVVGHLDLVRKNAGGQEAVETVGVRDEVFRTLEVIQRHGCILDVNTAGYRRGLGSPYPASWIVRAANEMGIGFCFGDDSHSPGDVGAGIEDAKEYLIDNGVKEVTVLAREGSRMVRRRISFE